MALAAAENPRRTQPHVAMRLYHSALQQLLDVVIVQLCAMPGRQARLADHQARMRRLLDP